MKLAIFAAFAGFLISSTACFASDTYEIDPTHAWVTFKINHAGWSQAHGLFKAVSGEITFDKADITNSSVSVEADSASISTNFEQRDADLQSPDFLNAAEFPKVTFVSSKVEKTGEKSGKVTGDLSVAGVTKPITLDVMWNSETPLPWDAKTIKTGFTANGKFNLVDEFGMRKAAEFGLGPEVEIQIDVEAIKKQ